MSIQVVPRKTKAENFGDIFGPVMQGLFQGKVMKRRQGMEDKDRAMREAMQIWQMAQKDYLNQPSLTREQAESMAGPGDKIEIKIDAYGRPTYTIKQPSPLDLLIMKEYPELFGKGAGAGSADADLGAGIPGQQQVPMPPAGGFGSGGQPIPAVEAANQFLQPESASPFAHLTTPLPAGVPNQQQVLPPLGTLAEQYLQPESSSPFADVLTAPEVRKPPAAAAPGAFGGFGAGSMGVPPVKTQRKTKPTAAKKPAAMTAAKYQFTATDPKTGRKVGWDGDKWVPIQ